MPAGTDLLTDHRRPLRETCKTLDEAKVALTKLQRQVDDLLAEHKVRAAARCAELGLELDEGAFFGYRYAGHLETGRDSISDPKMGGLI